MRIVTWNLWWRFGPWEARQDAIAAVLTDLAPDVVCLQEVWSEEGGADQATVLGDALGMEVAKTPDRFRNGMSFGNAILSRHPVVGSECRTLPPVDGPGHRQVLLARLDAPHGQVPVLCTHLEHRFDRSSVRQEQVAAVLRFVDDVRGGADDHPVVLAGDLNAVPSSDEIRMITGERPPPVPGLVMTDAWPQRGEGPGHTWHDANPHVVDSAWPRRRIDYVFVSWPRPRPLGNILTARLAGTEPVAGIMPSDHYAVVVDLAEGDPPPGNGRP